MIRFISQKKAWKRLEALVDQPLRFAFLYPEWGMFDFGLGEYIVDLYGPKGVRILPKHIVHGQYRIIINQKIGQTGLHKFNIHSDPKEFRDYVSNLIGLRVKRIGMDAWNTLFLDFGDYWVFFVTEKNGEESWRYFTVPLPQRHLVASDSWFYLSKLKKRDRRDE